jgi:hypothetical protein
MASPPYFFDLLKELAKLGVDSRLLSLLEKYLAKKKDKCKDMFTNRVHFRIFKQLPLRPVLIVASPSYLVFCFVSKNRHGRYSTYYVVGVNSDGKLFINQIFCFSIQGFYRIVADYPLRTYFTQDEEVWLNLGFEADLEKSSCKKIFPSFSERGFSDELRREDFAGEFRLQGDVCVRCNRVGSLEEAFVSAVSTAIERQVEAVIASTVLRRIQLAFADVGLSSEISQGVLRVFCLPHRYAWTSLAFGFKQALFGIIKEIDFSDIIHGVECPDVQPNERVGFDIREERWFGSFKPISITVDLPHFFVSDYARLVARQVDFTVKEQVVYFGRHKITYTGYPSRFMINATLPFKDEYGRPVSALFDVNLSDYFVDVGKLIAEHPEHGKVEVEVCSPFIATFFSVNTTSRFQHRLNYHLLNMMVERRPPEGQQKLL